MTNKLTVFGHPVQHSLSPKIHQLFAKQFDMDIEYTKTEVSPGSFEQAINDFAQSGGLGANVTVPFKQEAYSFCDQLSDVAQRARAVNTLHWQGDVLFGTNTDGQGLVNDLKQNLNQSIANKRLLILGAGGAAKGILGPLLDEKPRTVLLANRTFEKAVDLSEAFDRSLMPLSFDDLHNMDAQVDIVINATASSLSNELPPVPVSIIEGTLVYDLMYSLEAPTAFVQWAKTLGASQSVDGLGMLIEQAALSFKQWFDVMPDTQPVFKALR